MGGDIKGIISLALLVIVGLLALVGALKGLSRGIKRQTVRTVSIILSIVLSFVAVKLLYGIVIGFFDGKTMPELLSMLEGYGITMDAETKDMLSSFDVVLVEYILAIPLALLLGPIAFVLLFIIVSAIMWIVHAIVCGAIGFAKDENNWLTRLLGMALGAVQGVLVSIVLLVPVLGLTTTFSGAMEAIRANENKSEAEVEIIELYDNEIKDVVEDPTIKVLSTFGGNLMYDMLATIKVEDNSVKMPEQIDTVLAAYNEIGTLGGADFTALTETQQQSVKNLINIIGESNYFAPVLSSIAKSAATIAEESMSAEMEEPLKSIMADVFGLFKTSSKETIKGDLNTLCDFFFHLMNEGVLAAANNPENSDITEVFFKVNANGKTTISNAIAILESNDRTKVVVSSLAKISVAYAKEALKDSTSDIPELDGVEVEEIYAEVKESVTDIIKINPNAFASPEEYKAEVSASVESFIVDNGFVEQSVIDENREEMDEIFATVTEHITEAFKDKVGTEDAEITDGELIDVVLQYYNAYLNGDFNGGTLPGGEPNPGE